MGPVRTLQVARTREYVTKIVGVIPARLAATGIFRSFQVRAENTRRDQGGRKRLFSQGSPQVVGLGERFERISLGPITVVSGGRSDSVSRRPNSMAGATAARRRP